VGVVWFFVVRLAKLNDVKKRLIESNASVEEAVAKIAALEGTAMGRLFGEHVPFEATKEMWQEATTRIGEECDFVVIDCLATSSDVAWEAAHFAATKPGRTVLLLDAKSAPPPELASLRLPTATVSGQAGLRAKLLMMRGQVFVEQTGTERLSAAN
jgi:hypothetical protein